MCGRIAQYRDLQTWIHRFGLDPRSAAGFDPPARYNVHPVDDPRHPLDGWIATIRLDTGGPSPQRRLHGAYWGPMVRLRHGWKRVINARQESLTRSPLWRSAWRAGRRAIVPADGFYEWRRDCQPKQPYFITRVDGETMGLAALIGHSPIRPDGERQNSVVIITREASPAFGEIHHRMPAEIPEPLWAQWLDASAEIKPDALLEADPSAAWQWQRVGFGINNPRNDAPEVMVPVTGEAD